MNEEHVSIGPKGRTSYRCVTGHEIPVDDVVETTEVVTLDGGAVVRQCREHGAPIAIRVAPPDHD
jgi:hypothetical protein